jgi:DNA-binding transcriptional regulator YhcF (GntR family)
MKNNPSSKDKEYNQAKLIIEIGKYWETNKMAKRLKTLPTQKYLAEKVGLNIRTIKRHWAELKIIFQI